MKLIELEFAEFRKISHLFTQTEHLRFTIDAVIAGNTPGRIWVNDSSHPSSVFLWDGFHCYYLVGNSNNEDFNNGFKQLLIKKIAPQAVENNREIFKLEYSSKEWESVIESILKEKKPVKSLRIFLTLSKPLTPKWQETLPSDFNVRKIDKKLLESDVKNVQTIIDEITSCWVSVGAFLERGFGFCLIHEPKKGKEEVQGWCTGEYFSQGKCGIGIHTFPHFQKRGFATAMASAFIEQCFSLNIQPHWDASANNQVSVRVAENVGFEKLHLYNVFMGSFTNVET
ncbi:MAG: GNAT family N-acetyltransferase [Candidatus Hodarchaeales archaeon]|jgi:GNAT superfamily N-acetyltransferase